MIIKYWIMHFLVEHLKKIKPSTVTEGFFFLSIFTLSVSKMIHCSILLHHPAPGNPTHLSRHWVRWVALNIEQSPHFDIRRRLQACHPLHPSPPPTLSSPHLCFGDLLTNKVLRAILAAIVHFHSTKLFKRLDILDGESGWKRKREKEGGEW